MGRTLDFATWELKGRSMAYTADGSVASAETLFEVQQLQNGHWYCVSRHDNRDDATTAADAFVWRNRQAEVRVVHSRYDDGEGVFVERVVFRHKPTDPNDLKIQEQESAYSRVAARSQQRREATQRVRRANRARRREQWSSFTFYTKLLLLLVGLCGGAAIALQYLRSIN